MVEKPLLIKVEGNALTEGVIEWLKTQPGDKVLTAQPYEKESVMTLLARTGSEYLFREIWFGKEPEYSLTISNRAVPSEFVTFDSWNGFIQSFQFRKAVEDYKVKGNRIVIEMGNLDDFSF
jgi:hypothetical protein